MERRVSILGLPVFLRRHKRPKYHIALLVDEFFGGWNTAIGGYGALARKYICKLIPNDVIQIDLLLNTHAGVFVRRKLVDETMIYSLPQHPVARQHWLDKRAYNLFLSVELTEPAFNIIRDYETNTRLLYWIQDPRDLNLYQSRLKYVTLIRDHDWGYINVVSTWIQERIKRGRISFISQGESLSAIARKMFNIPETMLIADVANPVEIDFEYALNSPPKENSIIVLGRLEAQKRVWIVCEIAKSMPHYQFYILGATGTGRDEVANKKTLDPYRNPDGSSNISNLHFIGHVDGNLKDQYIKKAKLLLNTSLWEGIPISWIEALSYGTLLVAAFERDNIVGRFGTFIGEVMGDGTDRMSLDRFEVAIEYWMTHDLERNNIARKAIQYVRERHSSSTFINKMRDAIVREIE